MYSYSVLPVTLLKRRSRRRRDRAASAITSLTEIFFSAFRWMNRRAFRICWSVVAKAAVDIRSTILTGFSTTSSTGAAGSATSFSTSAAVCRPPSSMSIWTLDRVALPRLQSDSSLSTPITDTSDGILMPRL